MPVITRFCDCNRALSDGACNYATGQGKLGQTRRRWFNGNQCEIVMSTVDGRGLRQLWP